MTKKKKEELEFYAVNVNGKLNLVNKKNINSIKISFSKKIFDKENCFLITLTNQKNNEIFECGLNLFGAEKLYVFIGKNF